MAGIYKQGQGYWVRMMSAIAAGLLVFMGAVWLWDVLAGVAFGAVRTVYVQAICAVMFIGVFSILGYYLICRSHKVGDFMIATEGEMKKVNWSTRREILGSTWVVIGLTFIVAVIIGILDLSYSMLFQAAGVLNKAAG